MSLSAMISSLCQASSTSSMMITGSPFFLRRFSKDIYYVQSGQQCNILADDSVVERSTFTAALIKYLLCLP